MNRRIWALAVAVSASACTLGERRIGALTAGAGGSGGTTDLPTSSSFGSGDDAPRIECTADFVVEGEVSFVRDPGPDGVGTLYVRATAGDCMLGPALAVWASPQLVDVRDVQAGSGVVPFQLPVVPCIDGFPGRVRIAAFLSEGDAADPSDPLPRLGDMVNTITGEDGVAYSGDRAVGYTCVDVEVPMASVSYELDEFWFRDPPSGSDTTTATGP